ncbi:Uncharacterised protein [Vibrio cholerae]|nr:Uncharacterised protein [Vibrio cholerae]CSI69670.1 Uncharacterised protein [Vibrio cholerae]
MILLVSCLWLTTLCLLSIGNKKQGRRSKLNSRTLDHRLKRVLFCKA